jgi:hypothetical protein
MLAMLTYLTLDGRVLDLNHLTDEERAYFDRAYAAYRDGTTWVAFSHMVEGDQNPLLRPTGGRITPAVWDHPLFQAVRDLEDRVGVRYGGLLAEPGDDIERDPVADEWIPATQAAAMKGVTVPGLHHAIRKGTLIAHCDRPGRPHCLVSRNSLDRWTPNPVRQAAGRVRRSPAKAR